VQGDTGPQGPQGIQGDTGPGVVAGGTTGQLFEKASATDYDTQWVSKSAIAISSFNDDLDLVNSPAMTGVSAGSITGVIKCTQAQYDAITPDATILYVIVS
jgi:hypothetical protein